MTEPTYAERQRIAKRDYMRRMRATPEGRARQNESSRRAWANGAGEKQKQRVRAIQQDRFAWAARQHRLRYKVPVTADDLRTLWHTQNGHCALSGRLLDLDTAHLDHVVPISRGGSHGLSNLRWLDPQVNRAKRELLDEEFLALCQQVVDAV